jgi:hypothetical protein
MGKKLLNREARGKGIAKTPRGWVMYIQAEDRTIKKKKTPGRKEESASGRA